MTGVCLLGHIVNNCVTNNPNLPLSAAQGKALMDLYTVLNTNTSKVGHIHDERYYTETEVNNRLNEYLLFKTYKLNVNINGVVAIGSMDINISGYTPIGVTGWENGSNTATFLQRCEIEGNTLWYTVRSLLNTHLSANVYIDATVLYRRL